MLFDVDALQKNLALFLRDLSEDFKYFQIIPSAKTLKSIVLKNGDKLFNKIAKEHEYFFNAISTNGNFNRPQIAFSLKEKKIVFLHFLTKEQFIDQHTNNHIKYARMLLNASEGLFKEFYGYLIGDKLDVVCLDAGYIKTAIGFGKANVFDIENDQGFYKGLLYEKILFYDDLNH